MDNYREYSWMEAELAEAAYEISLWEYYLLMHELDRVYEEMCDRYDYDLSFNALGDEA